MQPLFASKQTSARIDFLRQGGRLVSRKGTHNVKILTKNQTKTIVPYTHAAVTARKKHTLTTASASDCRACYLRPTETASCKRTSNLALAAGFQLVERALNGDLHQANFWGLAMFCHGKWSGILAFSVSLSSTSYMRGVFVLALLHKDNKLRSI